MRKYVVGFIAGVVLTFSASVYADDIESLIGQKIQGQTAIFLDGTPLDKAIIVDGKSYAPTRSLAESTGNKVTFNEGGIYVETPTSESEPSIPDVVYETKRPIATIEYEITNAKSQIAGSKETIEKTEKLIIDNPNQLMVNMYQERIAKYKTWLAEAEAKLAALEAEKAALEK